MSEVKPDNVVYLVHYHNIDDDNEFHLFQTLDSAEEIFYAEVGRALADTNIDENGKCSNSIDLEYMKIEQECVHFGQIAYFASKNYDVEVYLYKMEVEK